MKFGLTLYPFDRFRELSALRDTVQLAEGLGFETVTIGEHVIVPRSHVSALPTWWYDSLTLGTAIAMLTRRLRICFTILVIPYYEPIRLAKAIATLDRLSEGRVTVGVGVGWVEPEFRALGVPFEERGRRTDEYLRAMKVLWTSDQPSFHGRWVSFDDIVFEPRPLQQPHPPIWVGGYGRRSFRRAAELGDGIHPTRGPWSKIEQDVAEMHALLARHGRNSDDFTFSHAMDYGGATGPQHSQMSVIPTGPLVVGREPDAVLGQVEASGRLGFSHIAVRFPETDLAALHRAMERFQHDVIRHAAGRQGTA